MIEVKYKSLTELKKILDEGKTTSVEVVQEYKNNFLADCKSDKPLNGYVEFFDDALDQANVADQQRKMGVNKPLLGLPIAIKDNISIKGKLCTCCSNILKDYIAPYDATVISRLKEAGAVLLGRTNMDEFAMGSSTEFSCYGPSRNPYDRECTPGGSSGGSAAVLAGNQATASLGTETGGSVRLPAAYCGLYGLKPTYGLLSRYGVTAFSSSLDQVGLFTNSSDDIGLLLSVLVGKDINDATSVDMDYSHFSKLKPYTRSEISKLKFLLFKEFEEAKGVSDDVKKAFNNIIQWLRNAGATIKEYSLPILKNTIDEYYVLTFPEAASNLSRFDGIRYGARIDDGTGYDDLYIKTRSQKFGPEVKRRIIIGNYILTKEFTGDIYQVGKKIQSLLEHKIDTLMDEYDIILCPTAPTAAFKLGEKVNNPAEMYLSDLFTGFANIARIPSLSIPAGYCSKTNLPLGVQLAGKKFSEEKIIRLAMSLQKENEF